MINDYEFNFRFLGNIEVDTFQEKLENLDWNKYTFRQDTYSVHSQTKTIPLIWDEKLQSINTWEDLKLFIDLIDKVLIILNVKLGKGIIKTAILINLPKYSKIKRHIDCGQHFKDNHRIHIPLQTNENCVFEVNNEKLNLKKGSIWEINNSEKLHSVNNSGNCDRIHLLVDYFKI